MRQVGGALAFLRAQQKAFVRRATLATRSLRSSRTSETHDASRRQVERVCNGDRKSETQSLDDAGQRKVARHISSARPIPRSHRERGERVGEHGNKYTENTNKDP